MSLRLLIGSIFLFALVATGCQQPSAIDDPYKCVNQEQLPKDPSKETVAIGKVQQGLMGNTRNLWNRPDHSIPICWQASTYRDEDQIYRDEAKRAVMDTWEKALQYPEGEEHRKDWVHFTGFEKCKPDDHESVRISVSDTAELNEVRCDGNGTQLPGKDNAVNFNFTFNRYGTSCKESREKKLKCIYDGAVHEFGHVLGMSHEDNRPDRDDDACAKTKNYEAKGSVGDIMVGPWDLESCMNYCNPIRNNGGKLSPGDIVGIRALYYPGSYSFSCLSEYKSTNQALAQTNYSKMPAIESQATIKVIEPTPQPNAAPEDDSESATKAY